MLDALCTLFQTRTREDHTYAQVKEITGEIWKN